MKKMRNNFLEILNNKVEIPIIQRDYAQGRTDSKTNKIRKDFLDVLFDFVSKKNQILRLRLNLILFMDSMRLILITKLHLSQLTVSKD
ncbi:hypothetical protein EAG08_17660 [Chryseobacterium sp. 3008163]|nr:hypothetical protein EAG08_17660 [Chryseobacterium sp. 3008163]